MPVICEPRRPRRFDSAACGREDVHAEKRIWAIDAALHANAAAGECRDRGANGDDLVQAVADRVKRYKADPKFSGFSCHAWSVGCSGSAAGARKQRSEARPTPA